jgi:UDP-GlcNAc:undecaprenyl-phosphate/decaprenyl-phosphate GlcNAc-1-phosphate transferase
MSSFLPLLVAFVFSLTLTPLAMRLARRVGAVDRPKADRWSRRETPLLGGVAITAGLLVALLALRPLTQETMVVAAGVVLLHVVGVWDDVRGLRPQAKLVAQTAAAGVLLLGGVRAGWPSSVFLATPLTVLWVVGITNALNLLDNMDGLAAGVGAITAIAVACCANALPGGAGDGAALVALAAGGAALGFLPWNVHPARVFMGDGGSLPLGFALAAASLPGTHSGAGHVAAVLAGPLLALAVPILDTTFVSILRKWHGRRISQGGRDHLSHRLVALGVPEKRAVATLWLLSAGFGAFAVASTQLRTLGSLTLVALALAAAAVVGVVLGRVKVYTRVAAAADAEKTEEMRRTFLNYVSAAGPIAADFVLAGAAYAAAYLLKYGADVPPREMDLLEVSIAPVVAIQLAALASCRVYRSVWRFFGMADAVALAKGCVVAFAATTMAVVFFWRFAMFSREVFVIDACLLMLFLFGARTFLRLLADAFGRFPDDGVKVLVVGAGAAGAQCLQALRARGDARVTPIGIVDDDASLHRRRIHGVPVVGSMNDLPRLLLELRPQEVVLSSLPDDVRVEELRTLVRAAGARLTLSPYARAFAPL